MGTVMSERLMHHNHNRYQPLTAQRHLDDDEGNHRRRLHVFGVLGLFGHQNSGVQGGKS